MTCYMHTLQNDLRSRLCNIRTHTVAKRVFVLAMETFKVCALGVFGDVAQYRESVMSQGRVLLLPGRWCPFDPLPPRRPAPASAAPGPWPRVHEFSDSSAASGLGFHPVGVDAQRLRLTSR